MDALQIQKASLKEVDLIVELLSELYKELGEESTSLAFPDKDLVTSILDIGRTDIYLLITDNKILGIFTLTESQAIYAGGKFLSIDEMYIRSPYRNQGIGKKCIDYIIRQAEHKMISRIDVTAPTEEKWYRTQEFYRENGFEFTGPKFKIRV